MITYSQLIKESKDAGGHGSEKKTNSEKHAVMAFGRMNPPTAGHEEVVKKMHSVAKEHGAEHHLVLSHSEDKKKNPLPVDKKVAHAKNAFPGTNVRGASKEKPTILHHAADLHKSGVEHLHVVAGSDRHQAMHDLLHKYNDGKEHGHGSYKFKSITLHSSGERDPDSEGTAGVSGTKMREHASSGNKKDFHSNLPKTMKPEHKDALYHDLRHHMGVKEEIETGEELVEGDSFLSQLISRHKRGEKLGKVEHDLVTAHLKRSKLYTKSKNAIRAEFKEEVVDEMLSANAKLVDTAKIKSNLHKPGNGVNSDVAKRMLERLSQKKKKTGGWFHKEETEQIDELSSELLSRYKEGAKKSADELTAKGQHKKSTDRWMGVMKATGKQIDKTTANIKKALRKEETEEQGMDRMKQLKKFKEMILDMQLQEVLSKDAAAGDWIHDFVHSDNPKFDGKSKEKRKEMALAAYYAKQRNEEVKLDEAAPFKTKEDAVKYAKDKVKTHRDSLDGIEIHAHSGGFDVNHTSNSSGRDSLKKIGAKHLGTIYKEEVELEESATVKTQKYSWGTMKTVHHGKDFSIPLHPEHHEPISKLKDNQEHKFKDETGRHWTAKRMGDDVHFHSANDGPKTKVAHKHIAEGTIQPSGTDKIETAGSPVSDIGNQNLKVKKVKSFKFFTTEAAKTGNPGYGYHGQHKSENDPDAAYDKMHSHVKSLTDGDDKTVKHYLDSAHGRHLVGHENDHEHIKKDFKKFKKHYRPEMHEEVELQEANHREFASQGKMHPDMAKHMKTGQEMDFYHSKTGDKISGVVKKNDGKEVHVKAHKDGKMGAGEVHKFTVASKLDEAAKPVNVDKVNAAGQEPHEEKWEPAKKKMKKESVSFSDFLKQLDEIKMADLPGRQVKGRSYGADYEDPEGAFETKDDVKKAEPKKAGRKVGQKVGARANLGNSKLHRA